MFDDWACCVCCDGGSGAGACVVLMEACFELPMLIAAVLAGGNVKHNRVDIFNASSGQWSAASLSETRTGFAATSLPNQGLAIFAGGMISSSISSTTTGF